MNNIKLQGKIVNLNQTPNLQQLNSPNGEKVNIVGRVSPRSPRPNAELSNKYKSTTKKKKIAPELLVLPSINMDSNQGTRDGTVVPRSITNVSSLSKQNSHTAIKGKPHEYNIQIGGQNFKEINSKEFSLNSSLNGNKRGTERSKYGAVISNHISPAYNNQNQGEPHLKSPKSLNLDSFQNKSIKNTFSFPTSRIGEYELPQVQKQNSSKLSMPQHIDSGRLKLPESISRQIQKSLNTEIIFARKSMEKERRELKIVEDTHRTAGKIKEIQIRNSIERDKKKQYPTPTDFSLVQSMELLVPIDDKPTICSAEDVPREINHIDNIQITDQVKTQVSKTEIRKQRIPNVPKMLPNEFSNQKQFLIEKDRIETLSNKSSLGSTESKKIQNRRIAIKLQINDKNNNDQDYSAELDKNESTSMSKSVEVGHPRVKKTIDFINGIGQDGQIMLKIEDKPQTSITIPKQQEYMSPQLNVSSKCQSQIVSPSKMKQKKSKNEIFFQKKSEIKQKIANSQQQKTSKKIQQALSAQQTNAQYFSTFQMGDQQLLQNSNQDVDFEQFYIFNNFAYQNIPNQNPLQLFGQGQSQSNSQFDVSTQNSTMKSKSLRRNYFGPPGQIPPQFPALVQNNQENKHTPKKHSQFPVIGATLQGGVGPMKQEFGQKKNSQTFYNSQPYQYPHSNVMKQQPQPSKQQDVLINPFAGQQLYHQFLLSSQKDHEQQMIKINQNKDLFEQMQAKKDQWQQQARKLKKANKSDSIMTLPKHASPIVSGDEIMIQGMSKDRALKAQRQLMVQQQVQYLMHQKYLQDEYQQSYIHNYNNFGANNKLYQQMTLRDIEECIRIAEHQQMRGVNNSSPLEADKKVAEGTKINPIERKGKSSETMSPQIQPERKEVAIASKPQAKKQLNTAQKGQKQSFWNLPQDIPNTKIVIHHKFDPMNHFNHKTNVTIRHINAVIRLIFKNTKDQVAITAVSPGTTIHQTQSLIDENRLKEIQKIANTMKVGIPRRFDSKTAIREFIQTREFISAIKQSMSIQLNTCLNQSNQILALISNKQLKIQKFFDKREIVKQKEAQEKKRKEKKEKEKNGDENEPTEKKVIKKSQKKVNEEKRQRDEELLFQQELQEEIERENYERDQEELELLNKEDIQKIEQSMIEKREKLKEKDKLLQFTQKYYVGGGNNYQVVKNAIKQRYWWNPSPLEDFSESNFIWTSWKKEKHVEYLRQKGYNELNQPLKIYGRMDNNKQLTNKKGLFINMHEYYQAIGVDPFSVLPLTFLVKHTSDSQFQRFEQEYNLINQKIRERTQKQQNEIQKYLKNKFKEKVKAHRQKGLYIDSDYEESEQYIPDDAEIKNIRKKWPIPLNTWILKPGENTNRGVGISVHQDINEVRSMMGSGGSHESTHIIQKYIDNPLLIHKRKFDFRVFALVTSINKTLKGYFYEDGYIRTSSREFDLQNLDDKFIHLTNDAIQKQAEDFGKFENCNKMSYGDFQRYLNHYHADLEVDVIKHLVPQMKKLICDTIKATCFKLDPNRLCNSFEMLGYDFMLDEDFKLSLIEVNTNPCLETESPLLARIIPELIENTFKIVLDPIFPSPDLNTNKKLTINELPHEIKYMLIFDQEYEGKQLKEQFDAHQEKMKAKEEGNKIDEIESDNEAELAKDDEDNEYDDD